MEPLLSGLRTTSPRGLHGPRLALTQMGKNGSGRRSSGFKESGLGGRRGPPATVSPCTARVVLRSHRLLGAGRRRRSSVNTRVGEWDHGLGVWRLRS